jgi:hypothetical protein
MLKMQATWVVTATLYDANDKVLAVDSIFPWISEIKSGETAHFSITKNTRSDSGKINVVNVDICRIGNYSDS